MTTKFKKEFKILKKNLNKLEGLKEDVIEKWVNYADVLEFFDKRNIDVNTFVKNFGREIYEHMLENIRKDGDVESCPALKEKLAFFKKKNASSEEIFIICKDFRRAIKKIIFKEISINAEEVYTMLVEIDIIFDNNLKDVLGYYSKLIIDDIHKKQKAYMDNLKMYEQIVEHMAESVWIGDEDERTIYANPEFRKIMGYSLEEMLGRESYDFWDEESIKTVKANNQLRQDGASSKYEGVLKDKHGKLIPVLLSGASIPGGGTVGIMTDMREIKTLQEAKDELKHLNQQKDEFISLVGHELRTPLTAIKGYMSMILDGDMGEVEGILKSSINQSLQSSERMLELVNDMLDLSRIQSGRMVYNMENIEVGAILDYAYTTMNIIFKKKNIEFELKKEGDIDGTKVHVDQNKLKQVIINLLNNSAKFTPEGGKVKLAASIEDKKVKIEIIDTGIGIPPEKLKKVFDKFYQVDSYIQRKVEGLGLGLALSQRFIKQFNSSLKVKSKEGEGSNFYFSLKIV